MGRKMTPEQKAEATKKRAAKKAEADVKKADDNSKVKDARVSVRTERGVKSRWRAGYQFGPDPREIQLADLTSAQIEALQADPSLVVSLEG